MLRLITAAQEEPVDLDFIKGLLRIDHGAFDSILPSLVAAARGEVERQTGYALAQAEYEWTPVGGRSAPLPILPATVLSADGVRPIMFRTTPAAVPEGLRLAIAMLVGDYLLKPEASTEKLVAENPALRRILFSHSVVLP